MNKNLRNLLALFGLAESQGNIEWQKWDAEQRRKLKDGEEFEPPWVFAPNTEPWAAEWKQGGGEHWIDEYWHPFWKKLTDDQKRDYFEKCQPPENWYQQLVGGERIYQPSGEIEWFREQKAKFETGYEIEPPWVAFPVSLASYGWDNGETERWKLEIWLPFWKKLSESEQEFYLEKWKPTEQWREVITNEWTKKLRKSDRWYEQQKDSAIWDDYVSLPWSAFPKNDSVYQWDEKQIDEWLQDVWIPLWNEMSGETRDEYLEHKLPPDDDWLEVLSEYEIKEIDKFGSMQNK
jgi:hypothetical protein